MKKPDWKSRKLWVYILAMIVGTVVWFFAEGSTFTDWKDLLVWMTGIYMGGNGAEHAANALSKKDV